MAGGKKRILKLGEIIQKLSEGGAGDAQTDRDRPLRKRSRRIPHVIPRQYESSSVPRQPVAPNTQEKNRSKQAGNSEINGARGEENVQSAAPGMSAKMASGSDIPPTDAFLTDDGGEEEEFDLFKYVGILLRRKEIIILATVVATIFAFFSYLQGDKYYVARSHLLFSMDDSSLLPQYGYRSYRDREKRFNTHLELLKSMTVLERVSQNLGGVVSAGGIRGGLTITQGQTNGEKNDMIEISFKHGNAEVARDVVNELCRTYVDYNREVSAQEDSRLIVKLKTQIDKLRSELNEMQNALRKFKEQHGVVQLSDEANSVVGKLNTMEQALQSTQLELLSGKEQMDALRKQISKQEINIVESMTYENPYQNRIAALQLELNTLSAEYSPNHFKVRIIADQIESLKKAMQDSITNQAAVKTMTKNPIRESLVQKLVNLGIDISTLEAKRTAQEQLIEKLKLELQLMPSLEQEYANLQRGSESMHQTLRMLEKKYEESKIARDSKESDLKILEVARTPSNALSTKKVSGVWTGALVGLVLGIGLVFLLEYLDQTLKDASQVEKLLELPLLGAVPHIEADKALVEKDEKLTRTVLEPFRALRANLKHLASLHNAKVLMVCSAVKGEGKTTLATNLALTFAMDGKKVILVDADLRRSQIHHYLDVPKEVGLADYLSATKTLPEIIKPTRHENMYVITSGDRPPNPAELLGTYRLDEMLKEIRSHADIIIFDSPATLPVSDSIIMAPKMDACIMVVRTLWTPLKAARQAKSQLKRIGTKMLGCILNGVPHSRGYYPYYYGYYGYYSYRYSYDEEPKRPFSWREFGLRAESTTREAIENARLALPHRMAIMGGLAKYIARKPLFWVLLVVLVGLAGLRLYFQPADQAGEDESSELVHLSEELPGVPINEGRSARNWPKKTESAMASSGLSQPLQENNSGNGETVAPKEGPYTPPQHANRMAGIGIDDSIKILITAWNDNDLSGYFRFYDPIEFRYPGGGFSRWREEAISQSLKDSISGGIIRIDSSWAKPVRNKFYQSTTLIIHMSASDTTVLERSLIWHDNQQEGWRIIRDKTRVISQKDR